MKKLFLRIAVLSLTVISVLSSFSVLAEDASAEKEVSSAVSSLVSEVEKLPLAKNVSINDKDLILKVKREYDALEKTDKAQLGAENLEKINSVYAAFEPYLLADVASRIDALPKRVKEKNKSDVKKLYEDYQMLSKEALESLDSSLVKKLENAVRKVAPELINDKDKSSQSKQSSNKKTSKPLWQKMGMTAWEFFLLAFLSLTILFNIAMIVVASFRIFTVKKS
mgnify:FL=1